MQKESSQKSKTAMNESRDCVTPKPQKRGEYNLKGIVSPVCWTLALRPSASHNAGVASPNEWVW
jgi:hypothetical protein